MTKTTTIIKWLVLTLIIAWSNLSAAQTVKNVTVILDWFVNPTHGPILIAQQKGFFKQHGLNVNLITPADPNDTVKMVALGKADIGLSSDPQLLLLINQGLPLLRVGALLDQPLVAVTSINVHELKDLKGKTIGYPVGGIDEIILGVMLHHVGLSLQDVNLVNVHYNLVQALLSKKVDAITGAMRDYEVPQLKLEGAHVYTFYPENYGMPPYAEINYIINRQHHNDPRVKAFLAATAEATAYIKQHPQQTWQMIIKQHPELNTPLNKLSWQMTYRLFTNQPGYTNQQHFMQLVRIMHQGGWLTQQQPFHYYVV